MLTILCLLRGPFLLLLRYDEEEEKTAPCGTAVDKKPAVE
jgi:hypothetical protein